MKNIILIIINQKKDKFQKEDLIAERKEKKVVNCETKENNKV
jgi:hypothetical protein